MLRKSGFQEIIEKYDKRIYNLLYSLCGNTEDAKELTQVTFIRAYKSFDRFRYESDVYTWLYRIAINIWKNKIKYDLRHKTQKTLPLEPNGSQNLNIDLPADESVLEKIEQEQTIKLIQNCIKNLPTKYRIAITLYVQNYSYSEMAKILKCSTGQTKSLVFRAKLLLRDKIVKI